MSKWKANLVTIASPSSDGTNYTGKANGIWKSTDQIQQKNASLWSKALLPPPAPTIGTATVGDANVAITFTAPSTINGDPITGYTLWTTTGLSVSGSTSPLTLTGLTNGTAYTFYVVANSTSGASVPSGTLVATPGPLTPSAPSLTVSQSTATSLKITITPPSNSGAAGIQQYKVTRNPGNVVTNVQTYELNNYTITGLTSFTAYTFTVYCYNIYGNSPTSSPATGTPTPAIGEAALGGYYAGQILKDSITYALIVAPRASGEGTLKAYQTVGSSVAGAASDIDGYANSVALVTASGAGAQAASFCRGLTIGGYNDWYLPSLFELVAIYYALKPSTTANDLVTSDTWANPYSVTPQPPNVAFTATVPAQTTVSNFQAASAEAFKVLGTANDHYWTSTQGPSPTWNTNNAWFSEFDNFKTYFWNNNKTSSKRARAIRRVAIT